MKRILMSVLVCMLSVLSVHAMDPWAEEKQSVEQREDESSWFPLVRDGEASILPKILRGEPLKVYIEFSSWPMGERGCATATQMVQDAYNAWFQNAANLIKAQHREKEFQDVLSMPMFQKGVSIEFNCVPTGTKARLGDVTVFLTKSLKEVKEQRIKDGGKGDALGYQQDGFFGKGKKVVAPAVAHQELNQEQVERVLIHELGHTLGIADAYDRGYKKFASNTHRSQHREYRTIMYSGVYYGLQPDDADGLINIIDSWKIHYAKQKYGSDWKKHVSARVIKGWDGLDRWQRGTSKDRYREGTSTTVQAQNISSRANSKVF